MSKCILVAGCGNLACDPDHGLCIVRQQLEAEQGYPEPHRPSTMTVAMQAGAEPRVLHAELPKEAAEAKVDESRVPDRGQYVGLRRPTTGPLPPEPKRQARMDKGRVVITNTPRAGESAEQTAARSPEARAAFKNAVKDSNPKDAIGVLKIALTYVSLPVILEVALGMMEGAFKYGRHNYREAGVRASVYVDATFRHLAAFWEGEDFDPDIQAKCGIDVSHITKAIASLTVLRDSMIRGNWVDDRPPTVAPGWIAKLSRDVETLAKAYPNPVPPVTEIGLRKKTEAVSGR